MGHHDRRIRCALLATAVVAAACSTQAFGMPSTPRAYHLAAQSLGEALRKAGRVSRRQVMFPARAVAGKQAPSVDGIYTVEQVIERLLTGSGLTAVYDGDAILIRDATVPQAEADSSATMPSPPSDVVVTGSRIRGAPLASPLITVTEQSIRDAGQTSVGDAIRSIPQNFAGGQNPGVTVGAGGSPDNANVGSGSTINLRGIGQAATLTLLNGHRLAYDIASQGIDVSTIPLAALDRIEVVADGASALYGSDAVAGVANIILKRDYDGLSVSARLAGATDGGDFQQQYSVVAGHRWASGGVIATYDYEHDTPINAGQRSYTADLNPGNTLLPFIHQHSGILSAHQAIGSTVTLSVDGTASTRRSDLSFAVAKTGTYLDYGILQTSKSTSFSVAPAVKWQMSDQWTITATGVYAQDHSRYSSNLYMVGQVISPNTGCYCNSFKSGEIVAEGRLFRLPAGDLRTAVGGGYRTNTLRAFRTTGSRQDIDVTQDAYYAFGELAIPLVAPGQSVPLIHRLSTTGALRYESYPGVDSIVTPKVGIVYAPTQWLDIKGSWGTAFKAPTLYQQYANQNSTLYAATALGGTGYPAGATAVLLGGANRDLTSERATTWTASLVIHPVANLEAQISYFSIDYRDRVAIPISGASSTLSNPLYGSLINFTPSTNDRANAVDPTTYIFSNNVLGPIDPSRIVAIIDNRYRNIARQTIDGVDAALHYQIDINSLGRFTLDASGTYLRSRQFVIPDQPAVELAGQIFNPPHLRGRGGVSWDSGKLTLAAYANYTGSLEDNRLATLPSPTVGSMTTLDLAAHFRVPKEGPSPLAGLDLVASVTNVLNTKPDRIRTTASYFPAYDSTNYSAVGRFASLTVSKSW